MAADRRYPSKIVAGLVSLSQGRCYWPDCGVSVIVLVENEPVFNFQIAHIAALNRTGARYQPEMSDKERNSFGNLILLCTPHHQYVDQIKPEDFSIDRLKDWKAKCETAEQAAALEGLGELPSQIDAAELTGMMRDAMHQQAEEIRNSVDELKASNSRAVQLVQQLIARLDDNQLVGKYVDADQVTMLNEAARNLKTHFNPDIVSMLYRAAENLGRNFDLDAVYQLGETAQSLSNLTGLVDQITALARVLDAPQLVNLPDYVNQLDAVVGRMPRQ